MMECEAGAIEVLSALGERVPLDALLPMLEDTDRNVREAAVRVLGAGRACSFGCSCSPCFRIPLSM